MWRLYIIYHQYIKPEFYEVDPEFDKNHVQLIQVSGYKESKKYPIDYSSEGYTTHKESDFEFYNPLLQQKKYHAPSVLYHVYKNNWYPAKYIGFLEYDFELKVSAKDVTKLGIKTDFGPSACRFIEDNLKEGRIIALSTRWTLMELNKQSNIQVKGVHWLTYFVQEYNKYTDVKISKEVLLQDNPVIPTQQSFICDIKSFKAMMGFIVHLIDNNLLEKSNHRPSTLLERYIGLCIYLCPSEVIYLPLEHRAHHGYE